MPGSGSQNCARVQEFAEETILHISLVGRNILQQLGPLQAFDTDMMDIKHSFYNIGG